MLGLSFHKVADLRFHAFNFSKKDPRTGVFKETPPPGDCFLIAQNPLNNQTKSESVPFFRNTFLQGNPRVIFGIVLLKFVRVVSTWARILFVWDIYRA